NFSPSLISRWKDKNPNIDRLIDIAKKFHISLDELIDFDIHQIDRDDFLNLLIENTQNNNIEWHSLSKLFVDEVQTYNLVNTESFNKYHPSKYEESTFYTKYQKGYIIIYSVYSKENCYEPVEIFLAIQPQEKECKLITQSYDKELLFALYLKIINSLQDEAPDEIKAEALKISFINEFRK
ncbi:MAG: helix-turn-helix domain-containing protein, partial [Ruminococcus flavefaciens]|nr:helix-turn-helix domain-containing protein [Ruminococcus flavefaciens]